MNDIIKGSYINIDSDVEPIANALLASNFAGTKLAYDADTESGIFVNVAMDGFNFEDLPDADSEIDNGHNYIKHYSFDDCSVFVESGSNYGLMIAAAGVGIEYYLRDWDFGDTHPWVGYAEFGLYPDLSEADVEDKDVSIWVQYQYSCTHYNAPHDNFLLVKDIDPSDQSKQRGLDAYDCAVFDNYQDAQAWIDQQYDKTYYLRHGEMARPDYTIVKT